MIKTGKRQGPIRASIASFFTSKTKEKDKEKDKEKGKEKDKGKERDTEREKDDTGRYVEVNHGSEVKPAIESTHPKQDFFQSYKDANLGTSLLLAQY